MSSEDHTESEDDMTFLRWVQSLFGGTSDRRVDPDSLKPGEYDAVHREDRGFIDVYDGFDRKPMMSIPEEDAERIRDALDDALNSGDPE